jgi:Rad3-related DNA helicase
MYNSSCKHFHDYKKNEDKKFNKEVERKILNNEILKDLAKQRLPTICPYFYPKRVKMMGTLYLMPYNYLLDSVILEYSTNFLKDSIIIFDEGHNVPSTACSGYSVTLSTTVLEAARRNVQNKLLESDFDAEEMELQNLIKEQKQSEEENEKEEKP